MIEVSNDSLEVGKFYLFFKKYSTYNPDIMIGMFTGYADDTSHPSSIITNSICYIMCVDHIIDVIADVSEEYVEMSVPGHSECLVFELDSEETSTYIMGRI